MRSLIWTTGKRVSIVVQNVDSRIEPYDPYKTSMGLEIKAPERKKYAPKYDYNNKEFKMLSEEKQNKAKKNADIVIRKIADAVEAYAEAAKEGRSAELKLDSETEAFILTAKFITNGDKIVLDKGFEKKAIERALKILVKNHPEGGNWADLDWTDATNIANRLFSLINSRKGRGAGGELLAGDMLLNVKQTRKQTVELWYEVFKSFTKIAGAAKGSVEAKMNEVLLDDTGNNIFATVFPTFEFNTEGKFDSNQELVIANLVTDMIQRIFGPGMLREVWRGGIFPSRDGIKLFAPTFSSLHNFILQNALMEYELNEGVLKRILPGRSAYTTGSATYYRYILNQYISTFSITFPTTEYVDSTYNMVKRVQLMNYKYLYPDKSVEEYVRKGDQDAVNGYKDFISRTLFTRLNAIKTNLPQHVESGSVKTSRKKLYDALKDYYVTEILPDVLKADPELDEKLVMIEFENRLTSLVYAAPSSVYRPKIYKWLANPRVSRFQFEWKYKRKVIMKFDAKMDAFFRNQGYDTTDWIRGIEAKGRATRPSTILNPNKEFFQKFLYGIAKASRLIRKPLQIVSVTAEAKSFEYGDEIQLPYTKNNEKIVFRDMKSGFYFDYNAINKKVDGFSENGFYIGNYEESEIISRLMSCLAGGGIITLSIADKDTKNSFVIAFDQHGVIGNFDGNELDGVRFNELKPIFESILDSYVPMQHSTQLMEYMSKFYLGNFRYDPKWKKFDDF